MPSPFFWEGLTRGVSQGFQASKAHKERKEKLELERRKLKLEEDIAAQKMEQLKRAMTGQKSLDTLAEELEGGAFGAPDERIEQLGGPPDPEALQPGEERQPPKPSLRDRLTAGALRQGRVPTELLKAGSETPITPYQRESLDLQRQRLNRPNIGSGTDSQLFAKFMQEMEQRGIRDPLTIRQLWRDELAANSTARGYGYGGGGVEGRAAATLGEFNVPLPGAGPAPMPGATVPQPGAVAPQAAVPQPGATMPQAQPPAPGPQAQRLSPVLRAERAKQAARTAGTPLEASTQKDITGLEGALRQVDNVEQNFDENFLGPIKGTETALSVRRRIGGYIGSPMGGKETTFRQALKDISDQLLRARSGAQINEAEFARLVSMLPQASDEPQVFRAGLLRFKTEMQRMIASKIRVGKTPRGELEGGAAPSGGDKLIIEEIRPMRR